MSLSAISADLVVAGPPATQAPQPGQMVSIGRLCIALGARAMIKIAR
jgi:hypothetical protein